MTHDRQHERVYFIGAHCEGIGDLRWLQLLEDSFRFFHAAGDLPNLTHLYHPEWDTLNEGFGWRGWWLQNSYGFSYAATPFLQEPWLTLLQNSLDLHWTKQGDGIRRGRFGTLGAPYFGLVGADGVLGDVATQEGIAYKQGDGDVHAHDWFHEGTAAAVVMQAEILLRTRDLEAARIYLPKMHRACESIERARDPNNNLFLVGPGSNLLAPSYGGVRQPDGTFGKGYLAGLAITYAAAAERMVELWKLVDEEKMVPLYTERLEKTRAALPLLLTPESTFAKSREVDGTLHGVPGQERFGYFEGVANVDALALRVADDPLARTIYAAIAARPDLRPHDFLLTNAPELDDTYWNYGSTELEGIYRYGDWVNGGAWGTVEGRAILGYYRVAAFEGILASATRALRWAQDYRMDAPWCQCGENTHNWWSDEEGRAPTSIMIDNFAIPAATIRGMFEWVYRADRLLLLPHLPPGLSFFRQKVPIGWGGKRITVEVRNGPGPIRHATVNGRPLPSVAADHLTLIYEELPPVAHLGLFMEGAEASPTETVREIIKSDSAAELSAEVLPESLQRQAGILDRFIARLSDFSDTEFDKAFAREARAAITAAAVRAATEFGPGHFRPFTEARKTDVIRTHEAAATSLFEGLSRRMALYSGDADPDKRQLAEWFVQSGGDLSAWLGKGTAPFVTEEGET